MSITIGNTERFTAYAVQNQFTGLPAWTPSEITTLTWYDAADSSTITESGGLVSQWNDKSGGGYNISQGTAASQPITNTYTVGGVNAIYFDGTNDWLATATQPFNASCTEFAMFCALDIRALETGSLWGIGTNTQSHMTWSDGKTYFDFSTETLGSGRIQYSTPLIANNVYQFFEYNSVTDGVEEIWLDGTKVASDNEAFTATTSSTLEVGRYSITATFYQQCYLGEIIFMQSTISTDTRQKIEGYLAWKWDGGTAGALVGRLPAGHPYKNGRPTVSP